MSDFLIVCTADSSLQTKAVARAVEEELFACGGRLLGVEGTSDSKWVLVDCGASIVHVFEPETREYYDLDLLWGDVPRIEWRTLAAGRRRKP